MAKITFIRCDVKPCTLAAEREFEVDGQKVYVCGEHCFVKFWSREYTHWKSAPYFMKTEFQPQGVSNPENSKAGEIQSVMVSVPSLQLIKPH